MQYRSQFALSSPVSGVVHEVDVGVVGEGGGGRDAGGARELLTSLPDIIRD